jgi:ribosomal protein S18 acetylase RimI-like enzyme
VIERVHEAMFHWYRLVGGASEGARVLEREGVVAAVVPAAPERAVVNAVLCRSAAALAAAYDELAAAYEEIRARWTVWLPPGEDEAAALLERRGHVLDAEPAAMARALAPGAVRRPPDGALPDWAADGWLPEVGAINDRAYSFGTDSFSRALNRLPDGAARVYLAPQANRPVACLMMVDHAGNSEVQMVAVLPEARGGGLAGKLLAHALADAAERGAETTTLIATRLGYPVYERAGYRPVGSFQMWERGPGKTH